MLLPDKHVTLAESTIGLGAIVLGLLDRPQGMDSLYKRVRSTLEAQRIPAAHDFDSVTLAVLFLYIIGTVEQTDAGLIRKCD
jgi:hypothetical protein